MTVSWIQRKSNGQICPMSERTEQVPVVPVQEVDRKEGLIPPQREVQSVPDDPQQDPDHHEGPGRRLNRPRRPDGSVRIGSRHIQGLKFRMTGPGIVQRWPS